MSNAGQAAQPFRTAVIGVGYLGRFHAQKYAQLEGSKLVAVVDANAEAAGKVGAELGVEAATDYRAVLDRTGAQRIDAISIAVIAVPAPSAQRVVDLVVAAGIKAVLNFSPGTLRVPPDVKLKSVDLRINLELLSFYLKGIEDGTA